MDLIPYSSVTAKGGFTAAIKAELIGRGFTVDQLAGLKFTALKKALKEHELARVKGIHQDDEGKRAKAVELAEKNFKQLSDPEKVSFVSED